MICLTGDIHHNSLQTGNQRLCDTREILVAQRYLRMLEEAGVKVTFFVTGKAFAEEWSDLKPICESENVEVGGHTYYCYVPELWHRIWNKLAASYNGPRWYHKWDTQKTVDVIRNKTGREIEVWRHHMYMHGQYSEDVLLECGIKICSDGVKKASNGLEMHPKGIYNFYINVLPDHEHLIHAERTPEWIEKWVKRYNWSDDFGPESYYIEEWTDIVLAQLKEHEDNGVISNVIIHPITLYLCDKFVSFRRILDYISSRETVFMTDILRLEQRKKT